MRSSLATRDADGVNSAQQRETKSWTVVVVDDEPDVFRVTQLVLRRFTVLGRPVRLLQCASGVEARECLLHEPSVAVLITDVVMEQDDAGLQLVQWAREQLHLKNMRIVIRTGQPGQAPETEVLSRLDINDYWTKQDLSSQRMQTLLTGLIRSYRDLQEVTELHTLAELELEANRQKLHELMEQEALFRAVSTSLSAGTILIDHGSILYMNKKSIELLGLTVGEGHWNDVVLPEPLCQAELPEHGEITIAQGSQSRWVDFHTMPIEQGAVRGHLVTLIDVSERRRTEDARLKAERDMLRTQHLKLHFDQ